MRRRASRGSRLAALIVFALAAVLWAGRGFQRPGPASGLPRPGPSATADEVFAGRVVGISDGDTISVLRDGRAVKVRLQGIDCPEKAQPFGRRAKEATSELAFGKDVRVRVDGIDRYSRIVGDVTLPDGRSLSAEILGAGLAWWYREYSRDPRLAALESEAREARRGLWADAAPTPPWEHRKATRSGRAVSAPPPPASGGADPLSGR